MLIQVRQPTLSTGQSASVGDITPLFGAVGRYGFGVVRFADIRSQRFMMHGSRQQLVQHVCQIRIHVKIVAMRGAYQSSRRVAGRSAASALPKCSQFFLPTASCFINCSTSLLSIGIMMRWHAHHSAGATGQLYQGRFKSFPTQTDGHGLTVSRDRVEVARTPPQCQARLAVWR